jgi:hypothetical protein
VLEEVMATISVSEGTSLDEILVADAHARGATRIKLIERHALSTL